MIFLLTTKKLKTLCRPHLHTDKDVYGGDDNLSKGVLLPLKNLLCKNTK